MSLCSRDRQSLLGQVTGCVTVNKAAIPTELEIAVTGQLVLISGICRDLTVHCYDTSRAKMSCGEQWYQSNPSIVPTGDQTLYLYLVPSLQRVVVQTAFKFSWHLGRINLMVLLQCVCRNSSRSNCSFYSYQPLDAP